MQTAPNGGWGNWTPLGGIVSSIEVGSNADGRLEVFAVGCGNGGSEAWTITQTAPNGGWGNWTPLGSLLAPNPNASPSPNWSGYVAATNFSQPQNDSVSAVYGSWVVPSVTGPSTGTTYGCVWVGIDGWGNSTVEQIGTEENWVNGRSVYYAWWEMYSTGIGQPEQLIAGMLIQPGDSISASVQYITSSGSSGSVLLVYHRQ